MMLLEAIQTFMMGKQTVVDQIGDRLYTDRVDEDEKLEAADMRIVNSDHETYLQGLAGHATSMVTFDCYSMRRSKTHAIAYAMMFSGITKHKGVVGGTDIRSVQLKRGPSDSDETVADNSTRFVTSFTLVIQWVTPNDAPTEE